MNRLGARALLSVEKLNNPHLAEVAKGAFKFAVGPEPLPRMCKNDDDYRKLAIAQLFLPTRLRRNFENWEQYPWQFTKCMHRDVTESDAILDHNAMLGLIDLQNSAERDSPKWNEAVATALMAQGRHDEARLYYDKLRPNGEHLPDATIVTAPRFGWPFPDEQLPPRIPFYLADEAAIGAAISGNVKMLQRLLDEDFILENMRLDGNSVASAAAKHGHVHVLRWLHENGVDVLARPVDIIDESDDEDSEEGDEDDEDDETSLLNSPLW